MAGVTSAIRSAVWVALLAALAAVGCSDSEPEPSEASDGGAEAPEVVATAETLCIVLEDETRSPYRLQPDGSIEDLISAYERMAAAAPAEIKEEVDALAEVSIELAKQLDATDTTDADQVAELLAALEVLESRLGEIDETSDRIYEWAEANCELPEAFKQSFSDTPDLVEPFAYGDDPQLDELYSKCEVGELAACDQLFILAPVGTDYSAYGQTCGGQISSEEGSGLCSVDQPTGLSTYGDNPELDALWDDCEAGQDQACDALWWASPFDSGYEAFAASCGGRTDREVPGHCVGRDE